MITWYSGIAVPVYGITRTSAGIKKNMSRFQVPGTTTYRTYKNNLRHQAK